MTGAVKAVTELERNLGKGKDVGDPTFIIYKKKKISCVGKVFPLDRGLLMGDPFPCKLFLFLEKQVNLVSKVPGSL